MYEKYTLKNGATVILVPQHDTRSLTTLVFYPVGSRYESENLAGAAHYIEHLMFKGTKKRPTSLDLTKEIDRLGAEYNAFTGKEYTGYYIKTDAEYSETAVDILSDMLFDSHFDAEEMEKEKKVIVEEIRMYHDNPLMHIDTVFEEVLFDGCALGRDIAGSVETVRAFDRDDVLSFRHAHYQPQHMIIACAGAVTDETKALLEQYFGEIGTNTDGMPSFEPAIFGSKEKDQRIRVQQKKTDQAQLMFGYPTFAYEETEKQAVLTVLKTILGGSMSSRLFVEIREKRGLAYMVRASLDKFRDTGYAYIRAGLEAVNINQAIAVIEAEIEKIKADGVTTEELQDAKTHIHGSLSLALEDSSAQASRYARQQLYLGKLRTPEESLAFIDAVTNDDIKQIANEIFVKEKMRVAVIGDIEANDIRF